MTQITNPAAITNIITAIENQIYSLVKAQGLSTRAFNKKRDELVAMFGTTYNKLTATSRMVVRDENKMFEMLGDYNKFGITYLGDYKIEFNKDVFNAQMQQYL